ncbi:MULTISPECIES: GNAT family N-acetyltransferase [Bacillales]|uniref:GNAT family N-acetyltransferase n=1 Tax=Bacillales TaxID=1385 RepID=UPI001884756E|nr:GNAT family N-acetyltransferase [Pseudalkalibacillus hwajinpoensis]MBF0709141.1 GNAT family N-acetyltransferase [Pseudalkalibacillus hwajinpoensis]
MNIRRARKGDEEWITYLLSEMGYETSVCEVTERLKPILSDPLYVTLVSEKQESLIGLLGMHYERSYVANILVARIITMVTAKDYRQQGVGKTLLLEAENLAREKGASTIVLNSGNRDERKSAHLFYEACGFTGKSTGFYKSID